MDAPGGPVLAVDVGGTKIDAAVVAGDGTILVRERRPTPRTGDPEAVFGALCSGVDAVLDGVADLGAPPPGAVGVGCGGPMHRESGTVSPINIPAWREFPLRTRLASHTGLPVEVDNDAKAFALGERWKGAAAGVEDFVALVVSTGVGGGVVSGSRLLEGATGNAGHIGHVIVEPDGRRCGCGARGCLEAEASGTAIAAMTGWPPERASRWLRRRTGTLVGRAIASVVNLLDLRLAVVGGSVAVGYGTDFLDAANEEVGRRSRIEFARGCRVVASPIPADAPLLGAAALASSGRTAAAATSGTASR